MKIIKNQAFSNSYTLITENKIILIDTGMEQDLALIEANLQKNGYELSDIDYVLLTHGHGDHAGCVKILREQYGVKVGMHHGDSEAIEPVEGLVEFTKKLLEGRPRVTSKGVEVDFFIDEDYDLNQLGIDGKVLYLPGHTKGSTAILLNDGSIFAGDSLVNYQVPTGPVIAQVKHDALTSFERLKQLKIKHVYPGHGDDFDFSDIV